MLQKERKLFFEGTSIGIGKDAMYEKPECVAVIGVSSVLLFLVHVLFLHLYKQSVLQKNGMLYCIVGNMTPWC